MAVERVTVARVTLLSPFAARRLFAEFRARPNRSRSQPSALAVVTEREREVLVLVAERRSHDD